MNKILKMMTSIMAIAAVFVFSVAVVQATSHDTNTVVYPGNPEGWTEWSTTADGDVNFVEDVDAPAGNGALQLTTEDSTSAKANYMHLAEEGQSLDDIAEMSYWTKRVSGPDYAAASYQIPVYLLGGSSGFTTLVYEPYQNGTVNADEWQEWQVDEGQFWSSRDVSCPNGEILAGGGGEPFYTLAEIHEICPDAIVIGYGVNIGSNNPDYDVYTDLFTFDDMVFDFELEEPMMMPTSKDDCKDGGWMNLVDENGDTFRNQGQCVSWTNQNL